MSGGGAYTGGRGVNGVGGATLQVVVSYKAAVLNQQHMLPSGRSLPHTPPAGHVKLSLCVVRMAGLKVCCMLHLHSGCGLHVGVLP